MPTDELEKLFLEAMPAADQGSSQTMSDLLESLRGALPGVAAQVSIRVTQPEAATAVPSPQTPAEPLETPISIRAAYPETEVAQPPANEAVPETAAQPADQGSSEALAAVLQILRGTPQNVTAPAASQVESGALGLLTTVAEKLGGQSSGGTQGGESAVSQALSTIKGTLLSAFPLFSGIASLFGGDEPAAQPVLSHYVAPQSIDYEGAVLSSNPDVIYGVDYGAGGMPRASGQVADFSSVPAELPASGQAGGQAPQITIQVQAMDSRSFLDHSEEIARAVKEAILNSNSLNDVLSEL